MRPSGKGGGVRFTIKPCVQAVYITLVVAAEQGNRMSLQDHSERQVNRTVQQHKGHDSHARQGGGGSDDRHKCRYICAESSPLTRAQRHRICGCRKAAEACQPENALLLLFHPDLEWELLQLVQQLNALLLHHTQHACCFVSSLRILGCLWTTVSVLFVAQHVKQCQYDSKTCRIHGIC